MDHVAVIMASCNGEKYIREQLESLASQTYPWITVYIHDDGSDDKTMEIIRDFIEKKNSPVEFRVMKQEKWGYPACFIRTLLEIPKADYYAFCDQDDVWFPDKIEKAVERIKEYEKNGEAVLYYSCVDYYDGALNFMRSARFVDEKHVVRRYSLQEMLLGGEAMGMTFLFNEQVRMVFAEVMQNGRNDFKDTFIKLYCASCGTVIYSSEPCAKYRRHSHATTVGMNPAGKMQRVFHMAKIIFVEPDGLSSIQSSVDYIWEVYFNRIRKENVELIRLFVNPNTWFKRIRKAFWPGRFRKKWIDELGYRVAFLMGRI